MKLFNTTNFEYDELTLSKISKYIFDICKNVNSELHELSELEKLGKTNKNQSRRIAIALWQIKQKLKDMDRSDIEKLLAGPEDGFHTVFDDIIIHEISYEEFKERMKGVKI